MINTSELIIFSFLALRKLGKNKVYNGILGIKL